MAGRKNNKLEIRLPKLFQRGSSGHYYFRRRISGKDRWINTHTADIKEAEKAALKILQAELSADSMNKLESSSRKLSDIFVAGITGKKSSSIKFLDAHDKWIETIPGYMDISIGTRSFHKTIFSRFSEWCISSGYQFIEQIDNAAALKYAKVLWESGISGKTYNDHISHLSRVFAGLDSRLCKSQMRERKTF